MRFLRSPERTVVIVSRADSCVVSVVSVLLVLLVVFVFSMAVDCCYLNVLSAWFRADSCMVSALVFVSLAASCSRGFLLRIYLS